MRSAGRSGTRPRSGPFPGRAQRGAERHQPFDVVAAILDPFLQSPAPEQFHGVQAEDRRPGQRRRCPAAVDEKASDPHPREGISAASRMYAVDRDIYRVLYSMAQLDPASVGGAVQKMEAERAGGMAQVAGRLAEDGALREGMTVARATDVLWMLCSFDAFDQLYTGRRLDIEETVQILVATAQSAVCT